MTVKEIKPNMLVLEYRQDKEDKDYGSCLWARFNFNLDRYELTITSDCGNYGYKWVETPKSESFLELMSRIEDGYLLKKLYGDANIFDYDATKQKMYKYLTKNKKNKIKLNEIFESFEWKGEPTTLELFLEKFEQENNGYFSDVWEYCEFDYPANALKIVSVFDECIRPKIYKIVKEQKVCSNGQICKHPNCPKCGTTHYMSDCDYTRVKEPKDDNE